MLAPDTPFANLFTTLCCWLVGKDGTTNMRNVRYRIVKRGPRRFLVEAFSDDHAAWRCVDEYPTPKEARARKTKLEQILERANRDDAGYGR